MVTTKEIELLDFSILFDYEHDNDREIVIVGCAFLETLIERILKSKFREDAQEVKSFLKNDGGNLTGLVARARLLYLLKVIPRVVFCDIKTIGKIRNHFAHNVYAQFSDDRIKSLCSNLMWHKESMLMAPPPNASSRDHYQVNINQLVAHLAGLYR